MSTQTVDALWDVYLMTHQEGWSYTAKTLPQLDAKTRYALINASLIHKVDGVWLWTDKAVLPGSWNGLLGL